MSVTLSENKIAYLEAFISKTTARKTGDILSNVKSGDVITGLDTYKKMKSNEIQDNYFIFGENASGYTVYSLYKSKNEKIYLINVSMQTPYSYAIIESETEFEGFYYKDQTTI